MPLKTFDDRNIQLTDQIAHSFNTATSSGEGSLSHTYTVSGSGFVVVSQSVRRTGSATTYGSSYGDIFLNSQRVSHQYNRLTTSNAEEHGLAMSIGLQVSDGDVISMNITQTSGGSKTFYYYCLCVGCTVTFS